jgi:hypothetical protein
MSTVMESQTINMLDRGVKGDGITDDTDAVQRLLNMVPGEWDKANNRPERWWMGPGMVNYMPTGIKLYAPGRNTTFKITRPLQVWGGTEIFGDGQRTMFDGRSIPRDRGLFEFAGVTYNPGEVYCGSVQIHHLALMSGGSGILPSPENGRPGALAAHFHNLNLCTLGYGIDFSNTYSQNTHIERCFQMCPGSGGLALWGNMNYINQYVLGQGHGGWDGTGGFTSPWRTRKMGQVDVRGHGNTLVNCHTEHGLPNVNRVVDPKDAIVPFYFGFYGPGMDNSKIKPWDRQSINLTGLWPEYQMPGSCVENKSVVFDHMTVPNGNWFFGNTKAINAGNLYLPEIDTNFSGKLSDCFDIQGETLLRVGRHIGFWGTDLPEKMVVECARQTQIFSTPGRFKDYDPNPKGADMLPKTIPWTFGVADGGDAKVEYADGGHTVTIDVKKRPPASGIGVNFAIPKGTTERDWVLLTGEVDMADGAQGFPFWWSDDPTFCTTNTNRTSKGRFATPLPRWKFNQGLSLSALGLGKHVWKNLKVTPL